MPDIRRNGGGSPTHDTVQVLLKRFHIDGERGAREQAIRISMPLARSLASRYYHGREPLEDLVQVACLGLVKAVDRYDPERGVLFSTFATPTILGELRRHFRDSTWALHVPRGLHDAALAVEAARERLSQMAGQTPTTNQLAAETGLSVSLVIEALHLRNANDPLSLESDRDGASLPVAEQLGSEDGSLASAEHRVLLADAMTSLPEHERHVLGLRFFADLTQSQIAGRVGVSQMQISRVLRHALDTLSRCVNGPPDPDDSVHLRPDRLGLRASGREVGALAYASHRDAGPGTHLIATPVRATHTAISGRLKSGSRLVAAAGHDGGPA